MTGELMGRPPVISTAGLTKHYGTVHALTDLTVDVGEGVTGLVGANGAGKSTLIKILLGLLEPTGGQASVLGHDIEHQGQEIRRLVGYMPEHDCLPPDVSASDFVVHMARMSGLGASAARERSADVLRHVGLDEERYRPMGGYSTGMKQRAKLAQALAHGPRLLFLDEPTNGLDPPARERMIRLIREIRDTGEVHVILSSHLLRDVEECCEEVLILKQGEIAYYCNLEAERQANRKFLELEIHGDREGYLEAIRGLGCESALTGKRKIKLVLPREVEIRELYRLAAERQVQIRHLDYKKDSLQDIFLKAMEGTHHGGV